METKPNSLDAELGLISEAEYAAFVDKEIVTIRNERSAGKAPPYVKIGNTVKYYISGVKQMVAAKTVTPKNTPTLVNPGRGRRT